MDLKNHFLKAGLFIVFACGYFGATSAATLPRLADFQELAKQFKVVLEVPKFEQTPEEIKRVAEDVKKQGKAILDSVAATSKRRLTFENTLMRLDEFNALVTTEAGRLAVIKETNPDEAMRDAASKAYVDFVDWSTDAAYRKDVYKVVSAYAATNPKLEGERAKFLEDNIRDGRRLGFHLPDAQLKEVIAITKELNSVTTTFGDNITKAKTELYFTKDELKGVPEEFLSDPSVAVGPNLYLVKAHIITHYQAVMDNCSVSETRKKINFAYNRRAIDTNADTLKSMLSLRLKLAKLLGYESWAAYQTEVTMAKDVATVKNFLRELNNKTGEKFEADLLKMKKLKAAELGVGEADASKLTIEPWDHRYYDNQFMKKEFNIDAEALRVYFSMEQVQKGVFETYEDLFGLKFTELQPEGAWHKDVRLFIVQDRKTKAPLGLFYQDPFPRDGKFNHFAHFGIIPTREGKNGLTTRPVSALICNYPAPTANAPSLLKHDDVVTFFHEFGHNLHEMMTKAKLASYAGTSVKHDFVEVPSQILENWAFDKSVLDRFAWDYRDPNKKISPKILKSLKESDLALNGNMYRRQIGLALGDFTLYGPEEIENPQTIFNAVMGVIHIPPMSGTHNAASFGHLDGYGARYRSYAWAKAIETDLIAKMRAAPGGLMDLKGGRELREKIFEPSGTEDPSVLIRNFLKRDWNSDAFLEQFKVSCQRPLRKIAKTGRKSK